jgi:ribose/xylose/arabinose/galactoside ABC-type transport system permease subunit
MQANRHCLRLSNLPNSIFVFLFAFVIASVGVPKFFSPGNLSTLLLQASILMILSTGMALVLMTGGIDLSMGGNLSMCGVVIALCLRGGMHVLWAIGAGVLCGALFGLLNGIFVSKMKVPSFIATFGSMGIAQSFANTLSEKRTIYWEAGPQNRLLNLLGGDILRIEFGKEASMTLSVSFLVLLTVCVIRCVIFLFKKTVLGAYIYAIGENEETARLCGIETTKWKIFVFMLSGALASVAALLVLIRTNSMQPTSGDGLEFQAVVAAVLGGNSLKGGKGNLCGALFGALTLYVVRSSLTLAGIDTSVTMIVIGAVLVVGMILNELAVRHEKNLQLRAGRG